jgi:hypothetical protein
MNTELDARALEAIVKARRIARNAKLVEIANESSHGGCGSYRLL